MNHFSKTFETYLRSHLCLTPFDITASTFDVSMVGKPQGWHGSTRYDSLNVEGLNHIVKLLLNGQLGLQKFGPLVGVVAVRYDASGGIVNWNSVTPLYDREEWPRFRPNRDYIVEYVSNAGGLQLLEQKRHRTLMGLPGNLTYKILSLVEASTTIKIDLDKSSPFAPPAIVHVNRGLCRWWHDNFCYGGPKLVLNTTASEKISTFDGFRSSAYSVAKDFHIQLFVLRAIHIGNEWRRFEYHT